MNNYRTIFPTFWTGETGKALRAAGPEAQLVGLYLLTNSHANALGLYYLPKILISHETALGEKGALKGLQRASEGGFCAYDSPSEVVWVYKMAEYQIGKALSPNDNRVKWINSQLKSLPKNPFLLDFYKKYSQAFHLEPLNIKEALPRGSEAPPKPGPGTGTGTGTEAVYSVDSPNGESIVGETADPSPNPDRNGFVFMANIVKAWQAHLSPPLPTPTLTESGYPESVNLQGQIRARIKEYKEARNIEFWEGLFENVKTHMPFLVGVNDRGWKTSLQWITGRDNLSKVLSGNYIAGKPVSRQAWQEYCEKLKFMRGECDQ